MSSVNYYLRLDGFKGESKAKGHSGETELLSFYFGELNKYPSKSGSGTRESVHLSEISVSRRTDSLSPLLMQYCATGRHIETGQITADKALKDGGLKTYLIIELQDIIIPSFQVAGESLNNGLPTESFNLNYGKIKYMYKS